MNHTANLPETQTVPVVRPEADPQPIFTRILVATDFSKRAETAVDYAVELARRMHAGLTLLHVFPEPSALDYGMGGFPQGEWDQAKEEVEKQLAEETMRAKLTYREVHALLRTGLDLRHEILSAAKEVSADLLVLSTHGYTGWKHFLFGSDAERILHSASCPILVVR
jgi:nucleotide-binding universal stress UspA family protein